MALLADPEHDFPKDDFMVEIERCARPTPIDPELTP